MGIRDLWFGKGATQTKTGPDAAASDAPPNKVVTTAADDAQAQSDSGQSAISTEPEAREQLQDEGGLSALTSEINTGNADVDTILRAEQKKLLDAFHQARQKDADKARADRSKQKAEEQPPKEESPRQPNELPRDLYKKHFIDKGRFGDENAQGFADTVPDIVQDVFQRLAAPFIAELARLKEDNAELRGLKAEHADREWNGVRSDFGPAADEFKDAAIALSKKLGISKRAALVEVSDGQLVRQQKATKQAEVDRTRPRSLQTAAPVASFAHVNGHKPVMSLDEANEAARAFVRQRRQELREQQ